MFELGHEKKGGRQVGTPNKRNQEINEYAEREGVNPARLLIDILSGKKAEIGKEPVTKDDIKWAVDLVMPYMFGKRKPVDSDGNDATDPLINLLLNLNDKL